MTDTRITPRKIIVGAATGLLSAVAGGFIARWAVHHYAGSPAWELPAIICGAVAVMLVVVLVVVPIAGRR